MSLVVKLAIAFLREHPIRIVLTSIATIASVCMVVWVASNYDTILHSYDVYANKTFGCYPLSVAPISNAKDEGVPIEVMEALKADPDVASIEPMWVLRALVRSVNPPNDGASGSSRSGSKRERESERSPESTVLALDIADAPFAMLRGHWITPRNSDAFETVVSVCAAKRLGVDIDQDVVVDRGERSYRLRVIGIMDSPSVDVSYGSQMSILTPGIGDLYVARATAEKLFEHASRISFLAVALKPNRDLTAFRFGWAPRLSGFSVPVQFQEASDVEEALCETSEAENVKLQAFAATGISLLVALLVIFSTLSMGASERVRQFAILRAVVFTRSKVALMIAFEGLILATIGFIGGMCLGYLLVMMSKGATEFFQQGFRVGFNTFFLAALTAYGGALLSALVPVYRAIHVRPVEAMVPQIQLSNAKGTPVRLVVVGFLLILVNPLLTFVFPPKYGTGVLVTMCIGFLSMAVGFVLIAPGIVVFVDRVISPLLGRMLGIEPKLLVYQISSNLWRSVGAAISMTIGLGLFISIQVWGYTMLDAFIPGPWVPDAIITFSPFSVPLKDAATVAEFPGVDPNRCVPLVVEQPRLLNDITNSAGRASVTRQDNVVIVGFDSKRAFGGDHPLLDLEWVQGSPDQAMPIIERQRGCVVPDHFLRETGLKIGDSFSLVPPENPGSPVKYVIAGAVKIPGWHWQTKFTGFRPRTHRAAALIFADYSAVTKDFDLRGVSHVWFFYGPNGADPDRLAASAQALFSSVLHREVAIGRSQALPYVRVVPVENLRRSLLVNARKWLWIISQLPLIALAVACLGVLNVIIASVRARRWSMGVLRAVGFSRGTLVRAVIAEGLLIGIVTCLLSLGFGILAGWCGCGISQYLSFFGGLHPSLVIPWYPILLSLLGTLILSAFTAVWPALSIGRSEPLTLLQQGRSAF
ncbi:MAG: ABC transporter permease [Candidatus Brocadiia bacterium]